MSIKKRRFLEDRDGRRVRIGESGPMGSIYETWRHLQHGQEELFRWGPYLRRFPNQLRRQSGHDHCCSVGLLFDHYLIKIRPHVSLDELLLVRCIRYHDVPEGMIGVDKAANKKRGEDDLKEYLVFEEHFKGLGEEVWKEMQRAFLLQFALENPSCFPEEARQVMQELLDHEYHEALFFDGVQRFDYLMYAYECFVERKNQILIGEVTGNQVGKLDKIADKLPGFIEVVWTPPIRGFFAKAGKQETFELA